MAGEGMTAKAVFDADSAPFQRAADPFRVFGPALKIGGTLLGAGIASMSGNREAVDMLADEFDRATQSLKDATNATRVFADGLDRAASAAEASDRALLGTAQKLAALADELGMEAEESALVEAIRTRSLDTIRKVLDRVQRKIGEEQQLRDFFEGG